MVEIGWTVGSPALTLDVPSEPPTVEEVVEPPLRYDPAFLAFLFTLQKGIRKGELDEDDLVEMGFDLKVAAEFVAEA